MAHCGGGGEGGTSNKDLIIIMLHPAEIEELGDPDQPLKLVRVERRCVEEVPTIITMRRSRIQRQIQRDIQRQIQNALQKNNDKNKY